MHDVHPRDGCTAERDGLAVPASFWRRSAPFAGDATPGPPTIKSQP